jgi:ABC-type transport system involved in multi-copper enzyme maturation permease subunit
MWKLIRLEWEKNSIRKYILGAVILIALLALFMFAQCYWGIANDTDTGVPDSAPGMDNMAVQIELFTNLSFLVFATVMLSSFIISAYKNRTENLMFCYPIKRQKIIISQMLAVWIFCTAALFSGKMIIYMLLEASSGLKADFPLGYDMLSIGFYVQIILKTILTVTLGFIPLCIGRLMNSSKAAIISSFLLFVVMNGTVGDFSMKNSLVLPIILFTISLLCAFFTVCNIEKKDSK